MKFRGGKITSTLILVVSLLLLLPLLAILQYQWLSQLSEREQEHMRVNLRAIANHFSQDFDDELTRPYALFFPFPELSRESGLADYIGRYDRWLAVTQYPRLIRDGLSVDFWKKRTVDGLMSASRRLTSINLDDGRVSISSNKPLLINELFSLAYGISKNLPEC